MTTHKSSAVAALIAAPPRTTLGFLLYGPDAGLVTERAADLARRVAGADGEILRLDERDLAETPDRLHVALRSSGLFGGAPVVRLTGGGRVNADMIRPLFETAIDGRLIVEAGPLRPGAPLRTLFEKDARLASLPCYAEANDLPRMIDEELGTAGIKISRDARRALTALLGGDQALSRSELRKLVLYCAGRAEITLDDVEAVVGDVAESGLDSFVDKVGQGDAAGAIADLVRLDATGTSPQGALAVLARHLADLHKASVVADERGVETAVRGMRPPVHFLRTNAIAGQIRRLGPSGLARALSLVQEAVMQSRLNSAMEQALVERLILDLVARSGRN